MARQIISQNDFTGGELSPRLYNRTDTSEYAKALKTAENVLLLPQGPIKRRSGTKFISEVKNSSDKARFINYEVSQSITYILELGDKYIRVYRDQGQLLEADISISNVTQANPAVVTTSAAHGLSNDDQVYITEIVGMTELNNSVSPYVVKNVTSTTFEVQDLEGNNIDSTGFTAYSSGGIVNRIFEIETPWDDDEIQKLQHVQRGTVMYIAHPDFAPRQLIRNSDLDWELKKLDLFPPPTFERGFQPDTTVTPGATTGLDVTFTAGTGTFLGGDEGRQIINLAGSGRAAITNVVSTTEATCDIVEDFDNTSAIASGDWEIDLSPIVSLEIDNSKAGSIATVRAEHISGSLEARVDITNISKANPAEVTTDTTHGYSSGDKVQIRDVQGMTQVNGREFTIKVTSTTTFELLDENSTNYTAYSDNGTIRRQLDGMKKAAFRSADVGKYILINGGVMQILEVVNSFFANAEIIKTLNNSDTSNKWTLEDENWDTTRGFPRAVGLFDERLVLGGTAAQPQSIWFSEIGDFQAFGIGPDDEDSIDVEIVSNQVNRINWLAGSRDLIVGTSGGELSISSGGTGALTPSNIRHQARTAHGSDVQQVVQIRDEILFIQGSKEKARTLSYDFNIDGYRGEDLTFLAEHLAKKKIKELTYAQEPDTVIYAVTEDGDMLSAVYGIVGSNSVIGWTKFTTDGTFENVKTIAQDGVDEVWTIVNRTIDGKTKRYVEILTDETGEDDLDGFVDSHLTLSEKTGIIDITTANPAVITTASNHNLENGDSIVIKDLEDPLESLLDSDKTNMSSLNQGVFEVANKTSTTFELKGVDTSNYNDYGSGGNVWERVQEIAGLSHLEGKTVQVRGDGAVQPDKVVSGGKITAESPAGEFVVGLKYQTNIRSLHIDYDQGMGSMLGQRSRHVRPILRVYKSGIPKLGGNFLPARKTSDLTSQKIPLFSGFLEYGNLGWSNTTEVDIQFDVPLPLQITGITGVIEGGVK